MTAYFTDSELILNPDGSVYHLNLLPEHIGTHIITVGDPDRVPLVSKYFDQIDHKISKREFVTHSGWLGEKKITVISTGIGTDNIDIVLNELDALANIDLVYRRAKPTHQTLNIIRIGTTGGLQETTPLNSYIASAYAVGLDGLLHFYEYTNAPNEAGLLTAIDQVLNTGDSFPVPPYVFAAAPELLDIFSEGFLKGITLTASGFYAPQGRELRAKSRFPIEQLEYLTQLRYEELMVSNFEMETAGIYGMASLLGHRALSCSLVLANRKNKTLSTRGKEGMDELIQLVLGTIRTNPFFE